jgi:hypothetical protein
VPNRERAAELRVAISDVRQALACMLKELENWRRRPDPGPSRGLARMDDEMSAALVALVAEAAQMQGAVLACLNEQSVQTEEGEQTSSWRALAAAAAAVEWRPALEFGDPELAVPLGEIVRDSADEAAVDTGEGVGDLHSAARRRDAVPDAEAETRIVAGLSRNAALMRRRLERRGLEALSDGRFVGRKLSAKACALTVAKLLAFLLLKAAVVSGVGAAQVVTLVGGRLGRGRRGSVCARRLHDDGAVRNRCCRRRCRRDGRRLGHLRRVPCRPDVVAQDDRVLYRARHQGLGKQGAALAHAPHAAPAAMHRRPDCLLL